MMGSEELNKRFHPHPGNEELHEALYDEFFSFVEMLDQIVPDGRYKSLMVTALEEAAMWSHKAAAEAAMVKKDPDDIHEEGRHAANAHA